MLSDPGPLTGSLGGRFSGALLARALDPTKRVDYLIVAVIASTPTMLAWVVGNHVDRGAYPGFWSSPNWWSHSFLAPVALVCFRWAMARIAPVTTREPQANLPGLIALVEPGLGRTSSYRALREQVLWWGNSAFAALLVVVFSVVDSWQALEVYVGLRASEETPAWGTMFVTGEVNEWANLAQLTSAYVVQGLLLWLLVVFLVLMVRHNLFFLGRVYQRRRVAPSLADQYIVIDLEDRDRCFGFRKANAAFNAQVTCLWLAGCGLLFSRFYHHTGADAEAVYSAVDLFLPFLGAESVRDPSLTGLLPDFGQWVIVLAWLAGLAIISMPILVKLLPRIPFTGATSHQATITGYLHEYLPDSHWPFKGGPSEAEVDALAARFAANAFWPTGNNRAHWLFSLAFFVGLLLLFPVLPQNGFVRQTLVVYASMFALAWVGTRVWLRLLAMSLSYIDPRLVERAHVATPTTGQPHADGLVLGARFPGRVFISYRRADSIAYAGRLHEGLERHCFPDRIFRDLEQIRGGEDFAEAIERALEDSDVCLVLIGPRWLDAVDGNGARRLDDPSDWVRLEVSGALERDHVVVIPVLFARAPMPPAESLPDPLKPLARLHAIEITDSRWEYDLGVLVRAMKDSAPPAATPRA